MLDTTGWGPNGTENYSTDFNACQRALAGGRTASVMFREIVGRAGWGRDGKRQANRDDWRDNTSKE